MATYTKILGVNPVSGLPQSPASSDDLDVQFDLCTISGASGVKFVIPEDLTPAFQVYDSSGPYDYLLVDTTTASEHIYFGNTSTNPAATFQGSGTVSVTGTLAPNTNIQFSDAGHHTINVSSVSSGAGKNISIVGGETTDVAKSGGAIYIDGGVGPVGTGKVYIGYNNAGDIYMSQVGELTHIFGDLTVDGTLNATLSFVDITYSGNIHGTKDVGHTIDINTGTTVGTDLTVKGGDAGSGDSDGGNLILKGGALSGAGLAGVVKVDSDLRFTTAASVRYMGMEQSLTGNGIGFYINGQQGKAGGDYKGGLITLIGGAATGDNNGGATSVLGGTASGTGKGGTLTLAAGESPTSGDGGDATLAGGYSYTAGGGDVTVRGGYGQTLGGTATIKGGSVSSDINEGPGGPCNVYGGDANSDISDPYDGGTVNIDSGAPTSTGGSQINIGVNNALKITLGIVTKSETIVTGNYVKFTPTSGVGLSFSVTADNALTAGDVVYVTATGVDKADATSTSVIVLGVAIEDIGKTTSAKGKIARFGTVGVSVEAGHAAMNRGDKVYLSSTTAGTVTATPPSSGTVFLMGVLTDGWASGLATLALCPQFLYNI